MIGLQIDDDPPMVTRDESTDPRDLGGGDASDQNMLCGNRIDGVVERTGANHPQLGSRTPKLVQGDLSVDVTFEPGRDQAHDPDRLRSRTRRLRSAR